jgi:precorrin-6Y C5,15-methyltransferase (decarboxylating)
MPAELRADPAPAGRWLAIVGIGEDGVAGLGEAARKLVSGAEFVFGGARHLDLARPLIRGETRQWPSPFDVAPVLALAGRKVCVLASGDPFLHGVGATLLRHVGAGEIEVVPAPSSFSLAAARMGWGLQDIETISLHGKAIPRLRPLLHPGRRVLCLTSDAAGPSAVAAFLDGLGFGPSRLTVLEALGGPAERIRSATATGFSLADVAPLNVVAIEVAAVATARPLPLTPGLPDDAFDHDGQITKREIRALTLSALAPRRGELLWDIGAGAGSVCIEWMLADPSCRAVAIEADPARAARIAKNAEALGVPDLHVVEGEAPAALAGLAAPDAVFVGGGGSEPGVLDAAVGALRPGGRLVANAVTLEMETVLLTRHAALGGELTRIAVSRAAPVGTMTGWRPAMPVTQWSWTKP